MIDTHIHLNDQQYQEDLEKVIQRTKDNGVEKVVVIGCDEKGIKRAEKILNDDTENFIYLALGWHPVDVRDYTEKQLQEIKRLVLNNPRVLAIGEIGLDYHWYPEEKEKQKEVFREQIKLAQQLDKPIIVHSREAYADCYQLLNEENYFKGVMHSFADTYEMAEKFINKGMFIGIGGPITFKNGINQKEVVAKMDLNYLVIETDGPYLAPVPFRGKRNESSYLEYICQTIAEIRNISIDEVKEITTKNAKRLFKELND